ncbi:molecular chaperone [Rheinheimera hassiensis]|uniref:fimbrial biogenesis chaperone n=1 Tax=Rheinheimera hassiensis TaxID=1193627 RepID=UPI001F0530E7|nr:fimbria/pilus periplasmic chaperone [Rheinheimera hassiensis]
MLLCYCGFTYANAAFDVSPIRLQLSPETPSAALTLTNRTDRPRLIEVNTMLWQRTENQDIYSPSRDILANPPVFEVAPYSTQIVRVGLNRATPAATERSYRVYLTEVAISQPQQQLQVVLSIGIPVFIAPAAGEKYQLHWQAKAISNNMVELTVRNTGNSHVQLEQLTFYSPISTGYQTAESVDYRSHQRIFPKESQRWHIALSSEYAELSFRYHSAQVTGEHTLQILGR